MNARLPGEFESAEALQAMCDVVAATPKGPNEKHLAYIERLAVAGGLIPAPLAYSSDEHLVSAIEAAEAPPAGEWGRPASTDRADDPPAYWDR